MSILITVRTTQTRTANEARRIEMKTWRTVEQRKVWSMEWGFGIVTAERSDGILGVQFDSNPWTVVHIPPTEVVEREA